MKQTSVFRVTGDICFYFAVLNVFSALRAWRIPMALFAVLCLALGFVIVRCKNGALRFALAVLPGLSFLMGPFDALLAFPVFAWFYYMLVMVRGHYAMPLYEYRKIFTGLLVICLFFLAANIANAAVYWNQVISADSLAYAFSFLLLGIIAMRRMQMGAELPLNWRVRNALSVVGVPVLAVGVSLLLFFALRYSQMALRVILEPVGRFLIWLFHRLFPDGHSPVEEMSLQEFLQPRNPSMVFEEWENSIGSRKEEPTDPAVFTNVRLERATEIGAWVALGILLALALYFVIRYARRNQSTDEEELALDEAETVLDPKQKRRKKIARPMGNARQLRRIYKTYLEFRRARGYNVKPADTSEEILRYEEETSEDAKRLRELYIAARYSDPASITRSQVLEAQACLERIMEHKNA